jgi:tetratricopeptide (TPR) repeat protein
VLQQLRRDAEAETLLGEVAEDLRARGGKSIRLAVALSNLGIAKLGRGDAHGGEPLVREAFEIKRELVGDESPMMAGAHSNLAYACDVAGKRDESLEHYLRAIAMCERDPELNRLLLATVHKNLARLHRACGRIDEAEESCRRAIEIRESQSPRDEPALADAYDNMGQIYFSKNEYKTAEEWSRKALEIYRREFGTQNLRTAMVLMNVGVALVFQNKDDEGEQAMLDAQDVFETRKASNPNPYRSGAGWLAKLYERQGKTEAAAKYRAMATAKP